ncbi:MAG: type II toxin-antitoxin system RelE/ParE family toxin [Candidatus Methanoperedenaceae archaeon]|nr:MAG: type II toxin-antitoxin system RelE/ParE family toxin [Candidatus Methanoperedenaceae archaeon]
MKFQIIWSESAAKELKKLDRTVANRIYKKVSQLSANPYHLDVTKMVGDPYFRLRVGDYRVIFDIQNYMLRVLVLKVGHRKNVYKK